MVDSIILDTVKRAPFFFRGGVLKNIEPDQIFLTFWWSCDVTLTAVSNGNKYISSLLNHDYRKCQTVDSFAGLTPLEDLGSKILNAPGWEKMLSLLVLLCLRPSQNYLPIY